MSSTTRLIKAIFADVSGVLTALVSPGTTDNTKKLATTEWVRSAMSDIATAAGFAVLNSSNGYIKLPSWLGGIILQWGTRDGVNNTTGVNVTFPIPFPTACYSVVATHIGPGTVPATRVVEVVIRGPSYFDAYGNSTANAIYWFAVGK